MTEHIVRKAKEYDRDTVPGDYETLAAPCPNCGGVVKENYRRYTCTGADGVSDGCGFSFGKSPAGRTFEQVEVEQFMRDKKIGPLDGFRSKAGWPFVAEMALKFNEEEKNWKLEFDFGDDKKNEESGEIVEFSDESLGVCPKCGSAVHEHGSNYLCSKAVPTTAQATPSCDFKSGKIILQQPVERAQIVKLLATGKTDLLDKFISNRTRRAFKAMLAWNPEEGKVTFEFAPREGGKKYPPRKTATTKTPFGKVAAKKTPAKSAAGKTAAGKTVKAPAAKKVAKTTAEKAPRKAAVGTLRPSSALMAVIGDGAYARTEVVKKIWDYIKANNLQDPADKRSIKADGKLQAVFGKDSATMFELAGIIGKHLS
jgi:DNA topoisomerase-3